MRSVGVQGDFRTYRFPAVLEFESEGDGFFHIPGAREKVEEASSGITNSAKFLNRTLVKLYQKPSVKDSDLKIMEAYCTKERLDLLREVDAAVLYELHKSGWYSKIFQHLTIMLPYASSEKSASFVLRPVCSEDVMTARFAWFDEELFKTIVRRIAALPFVDALYFDATNKPPATFGWE